MQPATTAAATAAGRCWWRDSAGIGLGAGGGAGQVWTGGLPRWHSGGWRGRLLLTILAGFLRRGCWTAGAGWRVPPSLPHTPHSRYFGGPPLARLLRALTPRMAAAGAVVTSVGWGHERLKALCLALMPCRHRCGCGALHAAAHLPPPPLAGNMRWKRAASRLRVAPCALCPPLSPSIQASAVAAPLLFRVQAKLQP